MPPRDAVAYVLEAFPIVKKKNLKATTQKDAEGNITPEGTYRTKHRILDLYDQMSDSRRTAKELKEALNPSLETPKANRELIHV